MAAKNDAFRDWVEGPLGVRMPGCMAKDAESALKANPEIEQIGYVRKFAPATYEFSDGERADVSVLTTTDVDRESHVVVPSGMQLDQYRKNPIVQFAHDHNELPIGRNLWIKNDTQRNAIVAKTAYATRPDGWEGQWMADAVWALVRNGTLRGKSVGLFPKDAGPPTPDELRMNPDWANARWIIRKCILVEYSVVPIPSNQNAIVEAVSKGFGGYLKALGIKVPDDKPTNSPPPSPSPVIKGMMPAVPTLSLKEYQRAIDEIVTRSIGDAQKLVDDRIARAQGRV